MRYSYSLFLSIDLSVSCNCLSYLYLLVYIVLDLSKGWYQPLKILDHLVGIEFEGLT